jgi:phosphotransferase system enzyme I (PtsI)
MTETEGEQTFQGLSVSGGVAIGPIYILGETAAVKRSFTTAAEEMRVFGKAVASAKSQLEALIASQDKLAGEILEFQLALLEDDELLAPVHLAIKDGVPCDQAWSAVLDAEIDDYRMSGGDTLAARASDLTDLRDRVLRAIHRTELTRSRIPEGAILVAQDLTPSAFLDLDWERMAGAAILGGSPTSHVSILARARGLNFIVALEAGLDQLKPKGAAILDAAHGTLTLHPSGATLASANAKTARDQEQRQTIDALLVHAAVTASGNPVKILVNIDEPSRLDMIAADHCDGVGLTRTEFLFASDRQPNEEEQLTFYRRLIEWAEGRPVTIRTLDAGGDKPIGGVTIDGEANPFLGVRGLRLSLARPEIFRIQLRALAQAAALGPVNVMFPMVTVPAELARARSMMLAEIADLERAGVACAAPRIGMMIEVPAAALTAADFDADFYSIGSNDLIQYVMASARDNPSLAKLADPLNPAVLELIGRTVEAARRRGVEISLCGDMASTPQLIGPLLDTGLRTLSCAPAQIGPVKLAVSRYAAKSG